MALILNLFVFSMLSFNLIIGTLVLGVVFYKIIFFPKLFYSFFIQLIFFQNTFIGFFSGFISSSIQFKILHGINFVVPMILVFLIFKKNSDFFDKNFFYKSLILLILLVGYTFFGFYYYGLLNSIVYLRLFSTPLVFLLAGIYFSRTVDLRFIENGLYLIFLVCVGITILQFLFPFLFSYLLNDLDYFELKKNISSWDELLAYYRSKPLFNISWIQYKLVRIGSLIKSFISLGYFLTIFGIYFYWPKKKIRFFLIVLLALISVNSKGAILFAFFTMFLYFLLYRTNLSKGLAIVTYFLMNAFFIYIGYKSKNEHILGFLHGITYLWSFGNGLGFGGNLSSSLVADYTGKPLLDLGYYTRFQNGSESVFGVLFSSLGFFSIIYILYFIEIIKVLYKKYDSSTTRIRVLHILTIILFVQGIYQEEAFSPYAFGLVMFLVGLNLKSVHENKAVSV